MVLGISHEVICHILMAILTCILFLLLGWPLSAKFRCLSFLQKYYCRLGWHSFGLDYKVYTNRSGIPALLVGKCKWCGHECIIE